MGKGLYVIICLLCCFAQPALARFQQSEPTFTIESKLKEANDYLVVLPERSLSILTQNDLLLVDANDEQKSQWHAAKMIASIRVANLRYLKETLYGLSQLQNTTYFQDHSETVLNALGVWLRRSGYLHSAKSAYICSFEASNPDKNIIRPLLNLAVVERNLANYKQSKVLNVIALKMAKEQELTAYVATIENNLGILAISESRYYDAHTHFSAALNLNERLNRRSGELLASMNLLLTFLYQENQLYFNRLYERAKRKLLLYPDTARGAYLAVLEAIHTAQTEPFLVKNSQQKILDHIILVNDKGLQDLLSPLINKVGVNYQAEQQNSELVYSGQLLQQYSMCNWNVDLNDDNLQKIIIELGSTQSQE